MKREIEVLLLKLANGGRVLRFSETSSGLSLEKCVVLSEPVAAQKKRWMKAFESMLDREVGPAN